MAERTKPFPINDPDAFARRHDQGIPGRDRYPGPPLGYDATCQLIECGGRVGENDVDAFRRSGRQPRQPGKGIDEFTDPLSDSSVDLDMVDHSPARRGDDILNPVERIRKLLGGLLSQHWPAEARQQNQSEAEGRAPYSDESISRFA